jgi:hypothetical protein
MLVRIGKVITTKPPIAIALLSFLRTSETVLPFVADSIKGSSYHRLERTMKDDQDAGRLQAVFGQV